MQSGNSLSGIMSGTGTTSNCVDVLSSVPFAGSFKGENLTLTSTPVDGQVVSMKASGTATSLTGTYSVEGGCGDGDKGTVTANYLPPLTGAWEGKIENPDGTAFGTLSALLTQSNTPTDGAFLLTGNIGFTLSIDNVVACSFSGTIPGPTTPASVSGNLVEISVTQTEASTCGFKEDLLYGALSDVAPLITINGRFHNGGSALFELTKTR
jgi:hypothetical protein